MTLMYNSFYGLPEKYDFNHLKPSYYLVYSLLDFYCDAIKHSFSEIEEGYDMQMAKSDIVEIAKGLRNNNFELLDIEKSLKDKLEHIFD